MLEWDTLEMTVDDHSMLNAFYPYLCPVIEHVEFQNITWQQQSKRQ